MITKICCYISIAYPSILRVNFSKSIASLVSIDMLYCHWHSLYAKLHHSRKGLEKSFKISQDWVLQEMCGSYLKNTNSSVFRSKG